MLLTISSLTETLQRRRIPACAKALRHVEGKVFSQTHVITARTRSEGPVSIFRACVGMWFLNLEGHYVKQIQNRRVGRLSKHAGHVSLLVCAHSYARVRLPVSASCVCRVRLF